ncbi:sensor histidine kinase [Pseudomonas sp. LJDD11]|uniref:sensor histidine kinase n=1 Tax=Pseudomonas sp. LJDD11 TaxID=2931984 RepID=UPI00359C46CA
MIALIPLRNLISRLRPTGNRYALILTAALGTLAILVNMLVYWRTQTLPGALLLFNLVTFIILWLPRLGARQDVCLTPVELAEHMLQVQKTERQRISRELHDDIGQMLTAARLQLDWLQRRLPDDCHEQGRLLNHTLQETLDKIRDLSSILNPRQLSSLGLEASLRSHLVRTLADSEVRWTFDCPQPLNGIAEEIAVAAFRITQEAVTNMLRHAQARNLVVRLQRLPHGLSLFIQDDGQGFEPALSPAQENQRGIAGMSERACLLGGAWSLHSEPGVGTRIEAVFPWAPRNPQRARPHKT